MNTDTIICITCGKDIDRLAAVGGECWEHIQERNRLYLVQQQQEGARRRAIRIALDRRLYEGHDEELRLHGTGQNSGSGHPLDA